MRRHLVQTHEGARHPFRQSLPGAALRLPSEERPAPAPRARSIIFKDDEQDWKLFLLSFVAFFTAFSAFIA